jgi:DTW domain-containing protein YfiP
VVTTRFVILQHPKEGRNAIGTGRLAHLALSNSLLLQGIDFSADQQLNVLLSDPGSSCALLYPGSQSRSLDRLSENDRAELMPRGRRFVLLVIDGTWAGARPILRRSKNLATLPRVSFSASGLSAYAGLRTQPREECLSTVEAIGRVIGLLESSELENQLLIPFRHMVAQQLAFGEDKTVCTQELRS